MSSRLTGYLWSAMCGGNLAIAGSSVLSGWYWSAAWFALVAAGSAVFAVACYWSEKPVHPLAPAIRRVK